MNFKEVARRGKLVAELQPYASQSLAEMGSTIVQLAEFAERIVKEYREELNNRAARVQEYIDEESQYRNDAVLKYWTNELAEAKRQTELSDTDLLQFIRPRECRRLSESLSDRSEG